MFLSKKPLINEPYALALGTFGHILVTAASSRMCPWFLRDWLADHKEEKQRAPENQINDEDSSPNVRKAIFIFVFKYLVFRRDT